MINPQELETPQLKHDKAEYLAKLPDVDRQNVERITELFSQVMAEKGRSGLLLAVGGTITKPLPRKDIDLAIAFERKPGDPAREGSPTVPAFSTAEFRIFQDIINTILEKDPNVGVTKIIEPFMDNHFRDPKILAHDGDVVIVNKDKGGVPIEFSREYVYNKAVSMREIIARRTKPFVVLSEVK